MKKTELIPQNKRAKITEMPVKEKTFDEKVADLLEMYPDVPVEIYDIEPSIEMAEMYLEEFGY